LSVKQKAFKEIKSNSNGNNWLPEVLNDDEVENLKKDLEKAFAALPPRCKEIFLLSRDNGLTYKEISEVLGISIKTVETQMGRALKKLRKSLAKYLSLLLTVTVSAANIFLG